VGCQRARPSPELRRRPRGVEDLAMERARVNVPDGFSSRASRAIGRAAADAQHMTSRIAQKALHIIFFIAPAHLELLLDGAIISPAP
jgi:hypothetical protein